MRRPVSGHCLTDLVHTCDTSVEEILGEKFLRRFDNSGFGMAKGPDEGESLVFVVDDDTGVRESLTSLLRSMSMRVEAFDSPAEFLKKGRIANEDTAANCLILDVRLPGISGLDFQATLAKADIHLPIIFSGHGDIPMTVRAMKAGAVEFLTKPFREQELLDAVQLALRRDRDRRIQERAVLQTRARFEALTLREQEVIGLVTAGLMNKQVAAELGVSEITVKVHRGNVMKKMGARSLADLVRMADTLGIRQAKH
jgi:FixJ family two-component response regulator